MNPSELGAARMILHRTRQQLDRGSTPEAALANSHRLADSLPLADKLLSALLLAWLSAANGQGRDIGPMIGDAEALLNMFKATAP